MFRKYLVSEKQKVVKVLIFKFLPLYYSILGCGKSKRNSRGMVSHHCLHFYLVWEPKLILHVRSPWRGSTRKRDYLSMRSKESKNMSRNMKYGKLMKLFENISISTLEIDTPNKKNKNKNERKKTR